MAKPKNMPPAWAPNAKPTAKGWADPKTGEILVSQRGLLTEADPVPAPEPAPEPVVLTEEPAAPAPVVEEEPAIEPAPKPKRRRTTKKKVAAKPAETE